MTLDLNLETLKREILGVLDASEFAVFHGVPGELEGLPVVQWDVARYPDYQMFLDVARRLGVKLIVIGATEFEAEDLDDLEAHVEAAGLPREEQREYLSRIRQLRAHEGSTCSLELAFDFSARIYLYDVQPDWYTEFLNLEEEILSEAHDTELDDDEMGGGFYSNN